jgi:hypothetical protein
LEVRIGGSAVLELPDKSFIIGPIASLRELSKVSMSGISRRHHRDLMLAMVQRPNENKLLINVATAV